MRLGGEQDIIPRDQPAELVWAQKNPEGGTTYGLRFVENAGAEDAVWGQGLLTQRKM